MAGNKKKNGGKKKNRGKGSPRSSGSPKKGRGGRSPKKAEVQEPLQEDPKAEAEWAAVMSRDYGADAGAGVSGTGGEATVPDSWDLDDDPQAEDDYAAQDGPQQVASTPTAPLALPPAAAASMTSPASDANTEELLDYLDGDDEFPVATPTPAVALAIASGSSQAPDAEVALPTSQPTHTQVRQHVVFAHCHCSFSLCLF